MVFQWMLKTCTVKRFPEKSGQQKGWWVDKAKCLTFQFLHYNKDSLWRLKHSLQVDNALKVDFVISPKNLATTKIRDIFFPTRVMQVLQYWDFILERRLLLRREPHLVDHLDGDGPAWNPVDAPVHDAKLAGAKHLVGEDLVSLADVGLLPLLLLLLLLLLIWWRHSHYIWGACKWRSSSESPLKKSSQSTW